MIHRSVRVLLRESLSFIAVARQHRSGGAGFYSELIENLAGVLANRVVTDGEQERDFWACFAVAN